MSQGVTLEVSRSTRVRWAATVALLAAAATLVAWTVVGYGEDLFYAYDAIALQVVAPVLVVALGVPAIWSRLLAANIVVFVVLVGIVEVGSRIVAPPPVEKVKEFIGGRNPRVRDASIGYRAAANVHMRIVERVDGEPDYDIGYETDAYGRRVVPFDASKARDAAVFLGCSFMLGEGVEAADTIPAVFARERPSYRPYLYALGGYGPSQALDQFRTRDIAGEIAEPIRLVVYYAIPAHVERTIGTIEIATEWCGHCANYIGPTAATLVRAGDFNRSRPLTTVVQSALHNSNFLRAIRFTIPDPRSRASRERTATVLEAVRDEAAKAAPGARFVVLMHPGMEAATGPLRGMLEARGIEVLSLSGVYEGADPRYHVSRFNLHPSAAAHAVIGKLLAEHLS